MSKKSDGKFSRKLSVGETIEKKSEPWVYQGVNTTLGIKVLRY